MLICELSPEGLVLVIVILPAYIHLWTIKLICKVFKPLSKNRWGRAWKEGLGASTEKSKTSSTKSKLILSEHRLKANAFVLSFLCSSAQDSSIQRLICIITVKC